MKDAAGNVLAPFVVNSTLTNVQQNAVAAMDAVGNFVVTWQSLAQDGSGWGVYGQSFDMYGSRIGGQNETQVITFTGQPRGTFQVEYDNGSGAVPADTLPISFQGDTVATAAAIQAQLRLLMGPSGPEGQQPLGDAIRVTAVNGTQIKIEFVGLQGNRDHLPLGIVNAIVTGDPGASVDVDTTIDGKPSEFLVNTTTLNNQMYPAIAMDAAGNFVVSWTGYGQDGDSMYQSNVYAKSYWYTPPPAVSQQPTDLTADQDDQIMEATPITLGPAIAPSITLSGSIDVPTDVDMYVFTVAAGQIIDFDVDRPTATGGLPILDTYLRLFNAAGVQLASNDNAQMPVHDANRNPALDGSDSYFRYTFTQAGVYYLGVSNAVNTYNPVTGTDVLGAMTGNATLYVGNYGPLYIFGTQVPQVIGSEFLVNQTVASDQKWSSVAKDIHGNFAISWTGYGQDGPGSAPGASGNGLNGVYVRRYDAGALPESAEFRANTTTANDQQNSRVAMNAIGDFNVFWESYQDRPVFGSGGQNPNDAPNSFGIYGQRYIRNSLVGTAPFTGANGEVGSELYANSTTDLDQRYPSITMDDNGDSRVVWSGNGVGDSQGVFEQSINIATDTAGPRVGLVSAITYVNPANPSDRTQWVTTPIFDNGQLPSGTLYGYVVTFTEDLSTTGNTIGPHSVINPKNWSITRNGLSVSKGIPSVQFGLNSATNKYEAIVSFDSDPTVTGNQPFHIGTYVLTADDTIQDKFGNALDDPNGLPGGDFVLPFSVPLVGTTTTLAGASPNPVTYGDGNQVTLSATVAVVSPDSGSVTAGTVNFFVDNSAIPLGTATVIGGTASIVVSAAHP